MELVLPPAMYGDAEHWISEAVDFVELFEMNGVDIRSIGPYWVQHEMRTLDNTSPKSYHAAKISRSCKTCYCFCCMQKYDNVLSFWQEHSDCTRRDSIETILANIYSKVAPHIWDAKQANMREDQMATYNCSSTGH